MILGGIFPFIFDSGAAPPSSSSLTLWLRGDKGVTPGSGTAAAWKDQSVNAANFVGDSSVGGTGPFGTATINGVPAVSFAGVSNPVRLLCTSLTADKVFGTPGVSSSPGWTFAICFQGAYVGASGNQFGCMFGDSLGIQGNYPGLIEVSSSSASGGADQISAGVCGQTAAASAASGTATTPHYLVIQFTTGSASLYLDGGAAVVSSSGSATGLTSIYFYVGAGTASTNVYSGYIGEILAWPNTTVSPSAIASYFHGKYGI